MKRTLTTLTAICILPLVHAAGMLCSYSLYAQSTRGVRGELMRSWEYPVAGWQPSVYEPRSTSYSLDSMEKDQEIDRYRNLDWLGTWTGGRNEILNFLQIDYQRNTKTYLYVTASSSTGTPSLRGWTSEGWARRTGGSKKAKLESKLPDNKVTFGMSSKGYVFSRVGTSVTIPSKGYLRKHIKNLSTSGHFSVLMAEEDGSAPLPPVGGRDVVPGELCPKWLHDTWVLGGFDTNDVETRNYNFRTYHPLWDPCYFCSYGHEHGSNAPMLMGYYPRYDYMALKNGNEDEAHVGFKDYVLDLGDYWLYYNVHAHLSTDRRLTEQFHTNVVRIVAKKGMQEMLQLQYKAFYGPLVGLDNNGRRTGLTPEDENLRIEQGKFNQTRREVQIKSVKLPIKYEIWATLPMCSTVQPRHEVTVLIKDPQTGLQNVRLNPKEFVPLGNLGINREFRAQRWELDVNNCQFVGDLTAEEKASGSFYTDPRGQLRVDGPGPNSVKQFIAPGFSISVSGRYEAMDTWLGVYGDGVRGRLHNVNQGVVGMMN